MCGFDEAGSTSAAQIRRSLILVASDDVAAAATTLRGAIERTPAVELEPLTLTYARELEARAQEFAGHVFRLMGARPVVSLPDE